MLRCHCWTGAKHTALRTPSKTKHVNLVIFRSFASSSFAPNSKIYVKLLICILGQQNVGFIQPLYENYCLKPRTACVLSNPLGRKKN